MIACESCRSILEIENPGLKVSYPLVSSHFTVSQQIVGFRPVADIGRSANPSHYVNLLLSRQKVIVDLYDPSEDAINNHLFQVSLPPDDALLPFEAFTLGVLK